MGLEFQDSEMFVDDPDGSGKAEVPVKMWCLPRKSTGNSMVNVFAVVENDAWSVYKFNEHTDRDVLLYSGLTLAAAKALVVILESAI